MMRLISIDNKDVANGMRNFSQTPLSEEEIKYVRTEIESILADESIFVFDDEGCMTSSTYYDFQNDKIYVTRSVFPDDKYGSTHPRDVMRVRTILAREYYGHRPYRDEYLANAEKGSNYHTTPIWQDECRASINAAKTAPNLTAKDKRDLVMDAIYRAKEYGHLIEMDDFMKEVVYDNSNKEGNLSNAITPIHFVRESNESKMDMIDRDKNEIYF